MIQCTSDDTAGEAMVMWSRAVWGKVKLGGARWGGAGRGGVGRDWVGDAPTSHLHLLHTCTHMSNRKMVSITELIRKSTSVAEAGSGRNETCV